MRLLQNLSFDVVLGSLAGGSFAVYMTGSAMPLAFWSVLPGAVWFIYTTDHILDAYKLNGIAAQSERHRFHQDHKNVLTAVVLFVGLVVFVLTIFYLPPMIIVWGVLLSLFSAFHLAISYLTPVKILRIIPKEMNIAVIYSIGIWLAPIALLKKTIPAHVILSLILYIIAALANLLMVSYFDYQSDLTDGQTSVSTIYGKKFTLLFVAILSLFGVLLNLSFPLFFPLIHGKSSLMVYIVLSIVVVTPIFLIASESFTLKQERFRFLGDLVFLLTGLPYVLEQWF